eukprot:1160025-Pelagomonas_calceolata.AAC.4
MLSQKGNAEELQHPGADLPNCSSATPKVGITICSFAPLAWSSLPLSLSHPLMGGWSGKWACALLCPTDSGLQAQTQVRAANGARALFCPAPFCLWVQLKGQACHAIY